MTAREATRPGLSLAWITRFAHAIAGPSIRTLIWMLVHAFARPSVRWHCQPHRGQRRVYFANHQSHFDWLLIRYAIPKAMRDQVHPVVAAEYWGASAFKRLLTRVVYKTVPLHRHREQEVGASLEGASQALNHGLSLILFPEGSRGPGGAPREFKAGLFHLAQAHPEVEFVPVWIDNTHRVLPKGKFVPRPVRCAVSFGNPIQLRPNESKEVFLGIARGEVMRLRAV